jgi:hypothetical protein
MKFRSLLLAVAGTLMLAAAFAPRAEAQITDVLYYWDFNLESTNPSDPSFSPPYTSRAPGSFGTNPDGSARPLRQTLIINGEGSSLIPSSNLNPFSSGSSAGMTIQPNGTLVNALPGDIAGNNLQLRASSAGNETSMYCFTLGGTTGMDFSGIGGLQQASISFALQQLNGGGPGHHGFTTLTLSYSLTGANGSFTTFATFTNLQQYSSYTTLSANLPTAVNGDSSVWVSFCFTGATDANLNNVTNIDNIQVTGLVPEPSTYIGGLLGIAGLCWFQRRRLIRCVRLRRT